MLPPGNDAFNNLHERLCMHETLCLGPEHRVKFQVPSPTCTDRHTQFTNKKPIKPHTNLKAWNNPFPPGDKRTREGTGTETYRFSHPPRCRWAGNTQTKCFKVILRNWGFTLQTGVAEGQKWVVEKVVQSRRPRNRSRGHEGLPDNGGRDGEDGNGEGTWKDRQKLQVSSTDSRGAPKTPRSSRPGLLVSSRSRTRGRHSWG